MDSCNYFLLTIFLYSIPNLKGGAIDFLLTIFFNLISHILFSIPDLKVGAMDSL